MSLSGARAGQLAIIILEKKLERDGIRLNPKEIKREIMNDAKRFGIPATELAEMVKLFYQKIFDQTMSELDQIE